MARLSYPSHDSGTILEQLINQAPWNINAGLPPVGQPVESQAGPTEANSRSTRPEERKRKRERRRRKGTCVCSMWRNEKCVDTRNQQGGLRMFFFSFNSESAMKDMPITDPKITPLYGLLGRSRRDSLRVNQIKIKDQKDLPLTRLPTLSMSSKSGVMG